MSCIKNIITPAIRSLVRNKTNLIRIGTFQKLSSYNINQAKHGTLANGSCEIYGQTNINKIDYLNRSEALLRESCAKQNVATTELFQRLYGNKSFGNFNIEMMQKIFNNSMKNYICLSDQLCDDDSKGDKKSDPCPKPCSKKGEDPCSKKKEDPCCEKKEDPCAKKKADPCAKKKEDPCEKKSGCPDDPCKKEPPCSKRKMSPCKKKPTDPCIDKKPEPCK